MQYNAYFQYMAGYSLLELKWIANSKVGDRNSSNLWYNLWNANLWYNLWNVELHFQDSEDEDLDLTSFNIVGTCQGFGEAISQAYQGLCFLNLTC